MQNDMRDRLIELLGLPLQIKVPNQIGSYDTIGERTLKRGDCERLADHLIANGVIVPPCKVGDTVWVDDFMWGLIPCKVDRPYHCICGEKGSCTFEMSFTDDDIGKNSPIPCTIPKTIAFIICIIYFTP